MSSLKYKYLLCIESDENANKFYKMQENADGTFTATYGRVGAEKVQTTSYPMSKWDSTYNNKTSDRKGYVDQTELFSEIKTIVQSAGPDVVADDTTVANLVIALQGYAKANTAKTYLVKAENVTKAQVDKAQSIIDELVELNKAKVLDIKKFNDTLMNLFRTIPRKMKEVGDHLVYDQGGYFDAGSKTYKGDGKLKDKKKFKEEVSELIEEEQSNLDTMASQVISQQPQQDAATTTKGKSLIESLGLKISVVTDRSELADIKSRAQEHGKRVLNAFKFENAATQKRFDGHLAKAANKKTEMFWHGSRRQNWWWIVQQGLKIRPSGAVHTGSMYGDGVYFAVEADKSMGYVDGGRWTGSNSTYGSKSRVYMGLYEVHVGKQYVVTRHDYECYSLSSNVLKNKGNYDSTFAKAGVSLRRNEFIVYNSDQSTIKYLVEFSD